jgi:hypothetical protein
VQSSGNGPVDEVIIGLLGIVRGLIRKYPALKSECTKDKYSSLFGFNQPVPAF